MLSYIAPFAVLAVLAGSLHVPTVERVAAQNAEKSKGEVSLCIAPMPNNFDSDLVAEIQKQKVPVVIVASDPDKGCNPAKSTYTITAKQRGWTNPFNSLTSGSRAQPIDLEIKMVRNSDNTVINYGLEHGDRKIAAEHMALDMLNHGRFRKENTP